MKTALALWIGLALAPLGVAAAQDTLALTQAREAIEAGRIEDAINLAQRYTGDHPRDERGFLVLGDAWFKQMPVGRFRASQAYQHAERLAPRDPAPFYRYAQVGLWLGGDDGEAMAKDGLERALALNPRYADAWDEWLTVFRNGGSRSHMRERLAPFATDPVVRDHIAMLDLEDERYDEADSLLDGALKEDSTNVEWLALRAQSAFEAGDTLAGWRFYRRALANAAHDSTDALWHQVIGIASPAEIRSWAAGVASERKRAWLQAFWARRNPDLFAGVNHRVAEHFARLRYARKHYPLVHPMVSYQRSQIARAINLEPSEGERTYYMRCETYEALKPVSIQEIYFRSDNMGRGGGAWNAEPGWLAAYQGVISAEDRSRMNPSLFTVLAGTEGAILIPKAVAMSLFAPLNMTLKGVDSVAARVGYNLATGLDDRGVMFLRFGPPGEQFIGGKDTEDPQCNVPDVERWRYPGLGEVRFDRPSAFSRGLRNVPDMVFRAMNERQFETVQTGLTRDASSEPAPLDFGVWTAQFRDPADSTLTDLVAVTTRGEAAASLVGGIGGGSARAATNGVVTTGVAPGRYLFLAQARDSGLLGRQTLRITIRRFDSIPALSDLLLAPAWDQPSPDREAMLERIERTLVFPEGSPIRSYAEVYGLRVSGAMVRYSVDYELLKTDAPERDIRRAEWPDAIRFEFQRSKPSTAGGAAGETLDITPDRVPAGKYLLRLRVRDLATGASTGSATIAFAVSSR